MRSPFCGGGPWVAVRARSAAAVGCVSSPRVVGLRPNSGAQSRPGWPSEDSGVSRSRIRQVGQDPRRVPATQCPVVAPDRFCRLRKPEVAAVTTIPDRSINKAVGLATRNKGVPADVAPTNRKPDDAALAKLTKKQQRFIKEYLVDYNATRAAQRAGYGVSDRNLGIRGFNLLRHPVISPEIRRLGAATPDEFGVTREYVVAKLREVVERALGDNEGWTPQSALRGLELISRLRGDLVERTDVNVKMVQVQLNDVDMEDLR